MSGVNPLFDRARQTNLCTSTFRFWPMRKARSVAWFSTAGFHQRSKWMTWEAAVRLRPVPPAFSESTKNGGPSSAGIARPVLPLVHRRCRRAAPVRADRTLCARKAASGPVISRNWVKTSTFSCREAISSHISAQAQRTCRCPRARSRRRRGTGRVIADLLEPHEIREHEPAALDAVGGVVERFR